MAKIGFEYIVAGQLNEDSESISYTAAREIGPAANVSITPNSADVKDYGDDRVVASDVSTNGGTISLELNEPTADNEAWLLGHEMQDGWIVRSSEDVPPYVGIGFVGKSVNENNQKIYRVRVLLKVQFMEPSSEYQTKEDNVTFNHTTLEGNYYGLDSHYETVDNNSYETLEEAKAAIDELFSEDSGNTGDENP